MHQSREIALLKPEQVVGISCRYEPKDTAPGTRPDAHTPVVFKSLSRDFKPGDLVVVEAGSRHKMTVVMVEETDVEIDLESDDWLRWIICKVDHAEFDVLRSQEAAISLQIKKAQRSKRARELRETVVADLEEQEVEALQIGTTAPKMPPVKAEPDYYPEDDDGPI